MRAAHVPKEVVDSMKSIVGLACWHVAAGRAVGSSFSLALGGKVKRQRPLTHGDNEDFRAHQGEFRLLVWSTWRLDAPAAPVASSDQEADRSANALQQLVGASVEKVQCRNRALDLRICFSGDLRLEVFSDHLPGDASIEQNWELWHGDNALLAGPGYEWRFYRGSPL